MRITNVLLLDWKIVLYAQKSFNKMKEINFFFTTFKFFCICATVFMVGYWLFKFQKNNDVTLIEYKSLDDPAIINDMINIELTICAVFPFISNRFNLTIVKQIRWKYFDFLKGKGNYGKFKDIQYDQVTTNLGSHLEQVRFKWKPGRTPKKKTCRDAHNCPYFALENNYNGFNQEGLFQKCFGTKLNNKYAKDVLTIRLMFNESLKNEISDAISVQVFFNYPNQFIRPRGESQTIWQTELNGTVDMFQITSFELLKRRNKRQEKCTSEWNIFDQMVLKKHIEKVGCRAPYMPQYPEFPMCNTQKQIRKAYYDGWSLEKRYAEDPCQEMRTIDFKSNSVRLSEGTPTRSKYQIIVVYPFKAKIITQLQEVDVHTLIGNIGGYIGLFLGKLLFGFLRSDKICLKI